VYGRKKITMLAADSSGLILLAKCSLLDALCDHYAVMIPSSVLSEVASDAQIRRYPDARLIAELVARGRIIVRDPQRVEFHTPLSLHYGDKDALVLAREQQGSLFASDDGKAIKAARFLRIPFIVTPKIVIELCRRGKISLKRGQEALEKLAIIGRYSPEIITEAMLALMEQFDDKTDNNQNT
jgi:predicted nucleic acid-binding protein